VVQLDLFLDRPDTPLRNALAEALAAGQPEAARQALARLREHDAAHPDLPALERLSAVLDPRSPERDATAGLPALAAEVDSVLVPVAERFLGWEAPRVLRPVWRRLAAGAAHADRAEADWPGTAQHWIAVALFHLGRRPEALRRWLALAWRDPAALEAAAPRAPDETLRDAWARFERHPGFDPDADGVTAPARWFPAWLLLREPKLAGLFRETEVPGGDPPGAALRQILRLLPLEARGLSDALVRERRALRAVAPAFFAHYLRQVGATPVRRLS
jgi:hypothetical protein